MLYRLTGMGIRAPRGKAAPPNEAADALGPAEVTPIDSIRAPVNRASGLRRFPQLGLTAIRVVRAAAPGTAAIAIGLQILAAILVGVQLLVVKELVVALVELARSSDNDAGSVVPAFAILLGVTFANGAITALLSRQQRMLSELVSRHTLDRILDVSCSVDLAKYEDATFYDQLQRATAAGSFRPTEMVNSLMTLLLAILTSAGITVALATMEPILLPLVLLAGLPILLATLRNSKQAYAFEYGMTTHARERLFLMGLMTERDAAKELRVFSATGFLRRRYDLLATERIDRMRAFVNGRLTVSLIGTFASSVGTGIALGSLVWLLATDRTDIATAATAAIAMQVLAGRLNSVTASLGRLVESSMFLEDLTTFLEIEAPRAGSPIPGSEPVVDGATRPFDGLRVEHLTFGYPGTEHPVIEDVSLEVNPGEVVALVGENGSGKTTLVKLISGLYETQQGRILFNGDDLTDLDPDAVRSDMTILFQDFVRYHLTAADNITLGRSSAVPQAHEIEAAARQAGAHDMLMGLPRGYQTRLGRQFAGGLELSGGEWQRLALARAFYRGGGFLIMDEPTAALDPRAEYRLFEQMRELAEGKTVLLISHRFSNVRMADRIYVMDEGRIVESGDHRELMEQDGLYAELFQLQASAYLGEVAD